MCLWSRIDLKIIKSISSSSGLDCYIRSYIHRKLDGCLKTWRHQSISTRDIGIGFLETIDICASSSGYWNENIESVNLQCRRCAYVSCHFQWHQKLGFQISSKSIVTDVPSAIFILICLKAIYFGVRVYGFLQISLTNQILCVLNRLFMAIFVCLMVFMSHGWEHFNWFWFYW